LANHLETSADSDSTNYEYQAYAYVAVLNACADSDNDGIGDLIDIDDDNDGVLDIDEITCTGLTSAISDVSTINGGGSGFHTAKARYELGTDTMTMDLTLTSHPSYWYDNDGDEDGGFDFNSYNTGTNTNEDYTFTMPVGDIISGKIKWGPSVVTNSNTNSNQSTSAVDITMTWNGSVTATMIDPSNQTDIADGTIVNSGMTFNRKAGATSNRTWYIEFVFSNHLGDFNLMADYATAPSWFGGGIDFSGLQACADKDTDEDETPDRLDLDSDGDMCYDVFESGKWSDYS